MYRVGVILAAAALLCGGVGLFTARLPLGATAMISGSLAIATGIRRGLAGLLLGILDILLIDLLPWLFGP